MSELKSPTAHAAFAPKGAQLIHTCYRVLDLERSVTFYEKLGFEELRRMPIGDDATNCFMGLPGDGAASSSLTTTASSSPYEIGTRSGASRSPPDDLDATLERLAADGIEPEKPPYRGARGAADLLRPRPRRLPIELIETA